MATDRVIILVDMVANLLLKLPISVSFSARCGAAFYLMSFFSKKSSFMSTATFTVRFEFLVDAARLNIILEADVQEHHSDTYYVVNQFRIPGQGNRAVLPD